MTPFYDRVTAAWPRIVADDDLLGEFARELGHALRALDDESLRKFRNLMAEARPGAGSALLGMLELVDGYRDALVEQAAEERADAAIRGSLAEQLVALLARSNKATTSELAAKLGKSDANDISRALTKLREMNFVESERNPVDARRRWHRLTLAGQSWWEANRQPSALAEQVAAAHAVVRSRLR
jgi:DNA-binding MarR family transcriptional regulator